MAPFASVVTDVVGIAVGFALPPASCAYATSIGGKTAAFSEPKIAPRIEPRDFVLALFVASSAGFAAAAYARRDNVIVDAFPRLVARARA